MGNDTIKKTLLVTVLLSLACSVVVSAAAVFLRKPQEENVRLDVQRNILSISGLAADARSLSNDEVARLYQQIEPRLVDLQTGQFVDQTPKGQTVDQYDQRIASKVADQSRKLTGGEDIAGIKRQANIAKVYLVEQAGLIDTVILPVHGYGLWSTMYGFLALGSDLETVKGFGFYDQKETPGLGGEVDNPIWKAKWPGKQIYDQQGRVKAHLVKGSADPGSPYQVDGLSGATLTSNGVTNLIRFWMGDEGFKPFLDNLKAGEA